MGNCATAFNVGGGLNDGGTIKKSSAGTGSDEQVQEMIKVVTSTGGVMELYAPITARNVTNEFPGHRLFCGGRPILPTDNLHVGRLYHLLPVLSAAESGGAVMITSSPATPYRMSFACDSKSTGGGGGGYYHKYCSNPYAKEGQFKRSQSYLGSSGGCEIGDVWSRCSTSGSSGVWKVRLVINPEHLSEILSQEARTEELIESVRTVAKCSSGGGGCKSTEHSDSGVGGWGGGSKKSGGRCGW